MSARKVISQEQLNEYAELTYLTKSEILHILKRFLTVAPQTDISTRVPMEEVMNVFPEIKFNPFRDRMFEVFSSQKDNCFSFEDFLDLCSVMSENCPLKVKASWAFKIFDFNNDGQITEEDLFQLIDALTQPSNLAAEEKGTICDVLLKEMDLSDTGGMNSLEFLHSVMKMPDFAHTFSFRI